MRAASVGPSVKLPMGPRSVSRVCRHEWRGAHAGCAIGASGAAPNGATTCVRGGCKNRRRGCVRSATLGSAMQLPMGPRNA
eukprot:1904678-Pyramimonas_sp.AAC.1